MNNRDHRKICVIDGHTGFTGGINLADEYINVKELHGHWKDTAIMLRGEAVWSLTVMFLTMWDFIKGEEADFDLYPPPRSTSGSSRRTTAISSPSRIIPSTTSRWGRTSTSI